MQQFSSAWKESPSSNSTVREGNGNPLQYSCLENPMDGGAWWAAVHGVAKSRTRLGDFTFTFHFHALEKEMATHSSVLAWRIPGKVKPGRLPFMESHRVGHNWSVLAAAASLMYTMCSFDTLIYYKVIITIALLNVSMMSHNYIHSLSYNSNIYIS